jgi:hypothetical protein
VISENGNTIALIGGTPIAFGVTTTGLTSPFTFGKPAAVKPQLMFAAPDCTGQSLGPANGQESLVVAAQIVGSSVYYVLPGSGQILTIRSFQVFNPDGSLRPCEQPMTREEVPQPTSFDSVVNPSIVEPLPIFLPPVHVE